MMTAMVKKAGTLLVFLWILFILGLASLGLISTFFPSARDEIGGLISRLTLKAVDVVGKFGWEDWPQSQAAAMFHHPPTIWAVSGYYWLLTFSFWFVVSALALLVLYGAMRLVARVFDALFGSDSTTTSTANASTGSSSSGDEGRRPAGTVLARTAAVLLVITFLFVLKPEPITWLTGQLVDAKEMIAGHNDSRETVDQANQDVALGCSEIGNVADCFGLYTWSKDNPDLHETFVRADQFMSKKCSEYADLYLHGQLNSVQAGQMQMWAAEGVSCPTDVPGLQVSNVSDSDEFDWWVGWGLLVVMMLIALAFSIIWTIIRPGGAFIFNLVVRMIAATLVLYVVWLTWQLVAWLS